jgi:hypothetical protein
MGLDQYAYKVSKNELNTDFSYESIDEDGEETDIQIAYWRKHPNLEGWMESVYNRKADAQGFDGNTEFPLEVHATAAQVDSEEISAEELDELRAKAIDDEVMKKTIMAATFAAMADNVSKSRVFNCQPIRLTTSDLDQLEMHVRLKTLPKTQGFFFGDNADDHYQEDDLEFISNARQAIADGYDVYYRSWW